MYRSGYYCNSLKMSANVKFTQRCTNFRSLGQLSLYGFNACYVVNGL